MKKTGLRIMSLLLALVMFAGYAAPVVHAADETDVTDEAVQAVITQLEAIDTLQQMQDKRYTYTVKDPHYDINTTDTGVIERHLARRAGYEEYVSTMFAARIAAQQAYDALTADQQAQIDSALVAKLSDYLPTVFNSGTFPVTPRNDEYVFEAVNGGAGYGYEVSNHMVSGNIPQTFVLVDTSDGATSWTPNGRYVLGQSNYEVLYCCDVMTALEYGTDYKRVNLEDSNYYGEYASRHIRAILQNSYPYVSIEEMKANLKVGGLKAEFVDSLTRSDLISAVQMAIWTFANVNDDFSGASGYFASINVPKNQGIYFTALHDFTNETWEWQPGKRQRSFDSRAEYRVNNLAYYLCNLPGVYATDDQIVISDIKVTRAELLQGSDGLYNIGMYVYQNNGGRESDDLTVTVTSYSENEDGTVSTTGVTKQSVHGQTKLRMSVKASFGDTVKVTVEGTQTLAKGVYFYTPEGGRDVSQSLVGVGQGKTNVKDEEVFEFVDTVGGKGLRIYKTEKGTGYPISDITFNIYNVNGAVGEAPTAEEIATYATAENLAGTVTTDSSGYGEITLEDGLYLVIEEHNKDKVVTPVEPFYLGIPMSETVTAEDGSTTVKLVDVVSVYPKNELVTPPEEPPIIPPAPGKVTGSFEILKCEEGNREVTLSGAVFAVYHTATEEDTDTEIITCEGVQYAVVPVIIDGEKLILETDGEGKAYSPEMECGTYFLVETRAPFGYNMKVEAVPVTVVSNEMTAATVVEVENRKGVLLPETGGIGTAPVLALGGIMTLGAAVALIIRKRKA